VEPQTFTLPFAQGIDESAAPELVEPGKLLSVRNMYIENNGALRKRGGFASHTTSVTTVARLARWKDSVVRIDTDGAVYTYGSNGWTSRGYAAPFTATREPIIEFAYPCRDGDMAQNDTYRFYAWISREQLFFCVQDIGTGAIVSGPTLVKAATGLKISRIILVGSSGYGVVTAFEPAGAFNPIIHMYRFNASTFALDSVVTVSLASSTNPAYDIAPLNGSDTRWLLAYQENITATASMRDITSSLSSMGTDNRSVDSSASAIAIAGDLALNRVVMARQKDAAAVGTVGVSWTQAVDALTPVNATTCTSSGSTRDAITHIGIALVSSTKFVIAFNFEGVAGTPHYFCYAVIDPTGPTVYGGDYATKFCAAYSKPFVRNSKCYIALMVDNGTRTLEVCELDRARTSNIPHPPWPCATIAPRFSVLISNPVSGSSDVISRNELSLAAEASAHNSSFNSLTYADFAGVVAASGAQDFPQITHVKLDTTHKGLWQTATQGEVAYIGGGLPCVFDGQSVTEIGFVYSPGISSFATAVGSGGSVAAGTYNYCQNYEWVTANGDVCRSAPSRTQTVVVGAGSNSLTLSCQVMRVTRKHTPASITPFAIGLIVYRTSAAGSVFYRLHESAPSADNAFTDGDNLVAGTTDTAADATNAEHRLLYTTGGIVNSVCPPSSLAMWVHKSRLWIVAEDAHTLYFSKTFIEGEQVSFADEFTVPFDDGGDLIAGASLDDKCVVFKKDRTYILTGDGPTDTAHGSDLQGPILISTDVGCIDPRSIVRIPQGLLFQSQQGFYLLTRSLQFTYVGERVKTTTGVTYPTCVASCILEARQLALFSMVASNEATGIILVYDYQNDAWFTWDTTSDAGVDNAPIRAMCADRSGNLYIATPTSIRKMAAGAATSWVDGTLASTYRGTVKTSWFRGPDVGGYARFQRFALVGRLVNVGTDSGVNIGFRSNYTTTLDGSPAVSDAEFSDLYSPYTLVFVPPKQKVEAIQLEIYDASSTSAHEFVSLTVRVIPKRSPFKQVPTSQKAG